MTPGFQPWITRIGPNCGQPRLVTLRLRPKGQQSGPQRRPSVKRSSGESRTSEPPERTATEGAIAKVELWI